MARYIDPRCRLCRRVGKKLFLKGAKCYSPKCAVERRGQRVIGTRGQRRRNPSERGLQLSEKQKAREIYGLLEKQFRRFFTIASKTPGVTGDTLIQLLERRLDNTVYRAGLAHSRPQARQLVCHGHFQVNGRRTDIPSYLVKPGDVLSWGPQGLNSQYLKDLKENPTLQSLPAWLSRDEDLTTIKILTMPSREEGESAFDAKAIVEFYAR